MKSTVQVLQEARALILDPANWGQQLFVSGVNGEKICASEALRRAYDDTSDASYIRSEAYLMLSQVMGTNQVCNFNDDHSHAEVIAAFDLAIAGFDPEWLHVNEQFDKEAMNEYDEALAAWMALGL